MLNNGNRILQYYQNGIYLIKIFEMRGCFFKGEIFFPRSAKAEYFESMWQMVKAVESDIERNHFPQNALEIRRWSKDGISKAYKSSSRRKKAFEGKMPLASFVIQIQFCQNATWQGTIQWTEQEQTEKFRSVYELLTLMEEALDNYKQDKQFHANANTQDIIL